jgi:hypothetical protein
MLDHWQSLAAGLIAKRSAPRWLARYGSTPIF